MVSEDKLAMGDVAYVPLATAPDVETGSGGRGGGGAAAAGAGAGGGSGSSDDAASTQGTSHHARRPLSLLPLIALIFFEVSGGPFGTEVRTRGGRERSGGLFRCVLLRAAADQPHTTTHKTTQHATHNSPQHTAQHTCRTPSPPRGRCS